MFSLFDGASSLPQRHMLITCVFFPWETVYMNIYEPENSWSHQSCSAPWMVWRSAQQSVSQNHHVWTTLLQIHSQNKPKAYGKDLWKICLLYKPDSYWSKEFRKKKKNSQLNINLQLQTTSFLWLFQLDDSKSLHKKWLEITIPIH